MCWLRQPVVRDLIYVVRGSPKTIGSRIPFRCVLCGECCRVYWVPVTLGDIRRIAEVSGLDPGEFLSLFPVEHAEPWDVPRFFLRIDGSLRQFYLVLRKRGDGSCIFLLNNGGKATCAIHRARPMSCRFYPFVYKKSGDLVEFHVNFEAIGFCPGLGFGRPQSFVDEARYVVEHGKELEETRRFAAEWNRDVVTGVVNGTFGELIERIRKALGLRSPTRTYR